MILGLGTRAPAWPFAATGVAARLQHDVEALPPSSLVVVDEVQRVPARGSWIAVAKVFVSCSQGLGARKLGCGGAACLRAGDPAISCASTR